MGKHYQLIRLAGLATHLLALAIFSNYSLAAVFTLDFEQGDLRGWQQTGNAFHFQPVLDDNPTARGRGQPSRHQGRYWIGTYEKYQGRDQKPGAIQGDEPTGTLTSANFKIPGGSLNFLIGGGGHYQTRVELLIIDPIEGAIRVLYATGHNHETMQRTRWDLSKYAGKTGRIRIVDEAAGSWGHINADDFRFSAPLELARKPPLIIVPKILDIQNRPPITSSDFVTVPRVLDHKLDDAINILRNRDLLPGSIDKRQDKQPANTVLFQNPAPGMEVKPESRIDLVIAIPKRVSVPGLIGRTILQARDVLKEFDLALGKIGQQATESELPGHIVRQRPEEGRMAIVGAEVDVAVAVQPPVAVPRLIEKQKDQAEEILAEHRLRLGSVRSNISDEEPGTIVDQTPEPGSQVRAGSSVHIVVARPEMVEVPPLVGLPRDEAAGRIQASRLRLGHVAERPSSKPNNTVIRQEPTTDTPIPVGSLINLVVSHPQLVHVPDLIGRPVDDASGLLEQAQLALGEIERVASEQAEGRILSQEPGPGAEAPVNTRVDVTVAILAPIVVPSLIGLTEEQAMHVLKEHKLLLGQHREQQSSEEQGTVIAQTPAPGIQVAQYAQVDLTIATARNNLLPVIAASALVLLVSASAYATVRFRGKRKSAAKLRAEVRLKPTADPGKSHVDPANGLDKGMDIRLRPVSDVGRQAVRTDTKIIEEDTEHD